MSLTDWRTLHDNHFQGIHTLVTGGAGFIGSHITEALLTLGASVVVLDDLAGGDVANLEALGVAMNDAAGARLRFVKGSILDRETLADAVQGCQFVFHQAALGSVPRSVENPVLFNEVNTTGTLNVLEASRAAGVKRVMFAASSSAYGDSEVLPKIETMVPAPRSPYAANKVAGEALMQAWGASYGLDTASLRYFNIFGPRQNANSAYAAVIAAFAKALFAGERPVIFGDGEQSRDFTFVDNAVHANLLAARCDKPLEGLAINVACGQRVTVNGLAAEMARLIGRPELTPIHKPTRAGDVKHSLAEMTRARQLLGYDHVVAFEAGLAVTVDWYKTVMT